MFPVFCSLLNMVLLGVLFIWPLEQKGVAFYNWAAVFSEAAGEGRLTWHQGGPVTFGRKSTNFFAKKKQKSEASEWNENNGESEDTSGQRLLLELSIPKLPF